MKTNMIKTVGLAALLAMGACGHNIRHDIHARASLTHAVQPAYDNAATADETTLAVAAGIDFDDFDLQEQTVSLGVDVNVTGQNTGILLDYLLGHTLLMDSNYRLNGIISPQVRVDTAGQARGSIRAGVQYDLCVADNCRVSNNLLFFQAMVGPGYQSSPAFDFTKGKQLIDVTLGLGFMADYRR